MVQTVTTNALLGINMYFENQLCEENRFLDISNIFLRIVPVMSKMP